MRRIAFVPILLAGAALAVAGCGSSGSSATGSTSASSSGSAPAGYGAPAPKSKPVAASVASVGTRHGSLGTFLVTSKGLSLYLFEKDHGGKSACSGACAKAWPPLITTGKPKAGSGVKASLLGTTKRADGSMQVTYAGHPLYRFFGDHKPGQTAGQGSKAFGAGWYVVQPSGKKIDKS